ncbi:MAG: type IV pilus assembly protein PilA [Rhodothermales bacterium]|jgi:type IV pilus assembly protein PilA
MNNMKRIQKGFTLIELMIVIAIVAILVALAVPAYQDYTIRTKVGECVNNAAVAKLSISEYRETTGIWPPDIQSSGLGTAGGVTAGSSQYCSPFVYINGPTFSVNVNETAVDAGIVGLVQPSLNGGVAPSGNIDWHCSFGGTSPANVKYLPATCRGT